MFPGRSLLRKLRAAPISQPSYGDDVDLIAHNGGLDEIALVVGPIAILAALLSEFPNATGLGTDISPAACAIARQNLEATGLAARGEIRSLVESAKAGLAIDPDTSMRNTRLLAGRSFSAYSLPLMPIRSSLCFACQGQGPMSVCTANGLPSLGAE